MLRVHFFLKRILRCFAILSLVIFMTGCEINYLFKSATGQLNLMSQKRSFEHVLDDPSIDDETKRKIKLVQKVKKFAEEKMALSHTKNYESYVLLKDRYVTYAVTASKKNKLEPYLWSFPFVGQVPYKGFFKKQDAVDEGEYLKSKNEDVMVRGVSAYSTLGWFSDPLLSSMTQEDDAYLIDTIIHETTHATIYIKSNADFNERLATFVGEKGTELFYQQEEGVNSPSLYKIRDQTHDAKVFFSFMGDEIKKIETYYEKNKDNPNLLTERENEFKQIQKDFTELCLPKLKTDQFHYFSKMTINNAVLIGYKMYYSDHEIFEKLFEKSGENWKNFFSYLESIKKSDHPEDDLKTYLK